MNIFYVNKNPILAAQSLVDRHVVKMVLESAQLLSTAHRVLDGFYSVQKTITGRNIQRWTIPDERNDVLYTATHINHPSAVWCRESVTNYKWLVEHFFGLCEEYRWRYGKTHKCETIGEILRTVPKNIKLGGFTKMPSCMDSQYIISENPVINYRNYYKIGKSALHAWKNRNPPDWIIF